MEIELTAWKAKLYDVIRKIDKLSTGEKQKMLMNIQDLNMALTEMEDKIESLKTECPADWSPVKKAIDDNHVDMRSKYEETMAFIGKAAPVSIPG
jgi:predicted nuclease with TOPRIM domain